MASITLEELHNYHVIDPDVFSRMVIHLIREPTESLLIMAIWLWLEAKSCPDIIRKLARLSDVCLNALADEAALCLKCLESNTIPFLPHAEMFHLNKYSAISGVKNFLNTIYSRIFIDILQLILPKENSGSSSPSQLLAIPGFPHLVFGSVSFRARPMDFDVPIGGLWGWNPFTVSKDDRTMFLTFSRGFPVTKEEVADFFTKLNGESVVDVKMQEEVPENRQTLFAKMILDSTGSVDKIMNGKSIVEFQINGKPIWISKYE